jgi:hypothetical protein
MWMCLRIEGSAMFNDRRVDHVEERREADQRQDQSPRWVARIELSDAELLIG